MQTALNKSHFGNTADLKRPKPVRHRDVGVHSRGIKDGNGPPRAVWPSWPHSRLQNTKESNQLKHWNNHRIL